MTWLLPCEWGPQHPLHGRLWALHIYYQLTTFPLWVTATLSLQRPLHLRQVDLSQEKAALGQLYTVQGEGGYALPLPKGALTLASPVPGAWGRLSRKGEASVTLESLCAWTPHDRGNVDFVCRLCARKQRRLSKATLSPLLGQGLRGGRLRAGRRALPGMHPCLRPPQGAHWETLTFQVRETRGKASSPSPLSAALPWDLHSPRRWVLSGWVGGHL